LARAYGNDAAQVSTNMENNAGNLQISLFMVPLRRT